MSSHASKTTCFIKSAFRITPNLVLKSVQNTSKMEPKKGPKRSRRPSPKKTPKHTLKYSEMLPKMTPKKEPKITKKRFGLPFSHLKKTMIFLKVFFLVFCAPQEALDPQNRAKTEVPRFSPETAFFYKNVPKMATLGAPRNSQKLIKPLKKNHQKRN